jgi:Kae1-associated kinase Bud32
MDEMKRGTKLMFRKGAEANLYLHCWHGKNVLVKQRISKGQEAKLLTDARRAGVPTPSIFLVDIINTTIIMEYIKGKTIKEIIDTIPKNKRKKLFFRIGEMIARLHQNDIIHGDLTTSNIIMTSNEKLYFVDFGLGAYSSEIEPKGIDLHLMKRTFESTHHRYQCECYSSVLRGYRYTMGDQANPILTRLDEIETRGRYTPRDKKKR